MKTTTLILFCFLANLTVKSQDVIFLRTGEEIQAKILEIGIATIKYKKFENKEDLPIYIISKSDIFMIKYEGGTKELFEEEKPISNESIELNVKSASELCTDGRHDAIMNYNTGRPFRAGLIPTLIFAPAGLLVSIIVADYKPNMRNLNAPDMSLIKNHDYKRCYVDEVKRMKRRKVWGGFGIGVGINLAVWILLF